MFFFEATSTLFFVDVHLADGLTPKSEAAAMAKMLLPVPHHEVTHSQLVSPGSPNC